jgi:hypothetical protein
MSKWLEIWTVYYWEHMEDTVILVEWIVHLSCVFIIPPNYINKLRNVLK